MTKSEKLIAGLIAVGALGLIGFAIAANKPLTVKTPYGTIQTAPEKCDAVLSDVESSNNGGDGVVLKGQGTHCVDRMKSHDNVGNGVVVDRTSVQPPAVTPPAAAPDKLLPGQH